MDEPAKEQDGAPLLPAPAATTEGEGAVGGDDASGGEEPRRRSTSRRSFAAEVLGADRQPDRAAQGPEADRPPGRRRRKRGSMRSCDAAAPIADALAKRSKARRGRCCGEGSQAAGFLDGLKDGVCTRACASCSRSSSWAACRREGSGRHVNAVCRGQIEASLSTALDKLGNKAGALKRHLAPRGIRGRALDAVLKAATKYNVRVGTFDGASTCCGWRGRAAASTSAGTSSSSPHHETCCARGAGGDGPTGATRRTRGSRCATAWPASCAAGVAVLDCMCGDDAVLKALGAARSLWTPRARPDRAGHRHLEGSRRPHPQRRQARPPPPRPPRTPARASTSTSTSTSPQGGLPKRLNKEIILIRRVKELQMRAVAGLGTLLVALAVTTGQYFGTAVYDVVKSLEKQPLTWVLPVAVVVGLLVLGLLARGRASGAARSGARRRARPLAERPGRAVGRVSRLRVGAAPTPSHPRRSVPSRTYPSRSPRDRRGAPLSHPEPLPPSRPARK